MDLNASVKINKEISSLQNKIDTFNNAEKMINDVLEIIELAEADNDESLLDGIDEEILSVSKAVEDMRLKTLLKGKYDNSNALLMLHAGAGGTEACDWTEMLYRMYICYAEKNGFVVNELDRLEGDGAGLKSVSFKIEGENAYGYLKAEKGIHRLVRISPFDANKKRHTSFASLEVMPEIEEDDDIKINSEDLRIDTFRSSGAGGQHINKTDSAIRITHLPTGIVVACQNERSQTQNKEMAMKMLYSKLAEKQEKEKEEERLKKLGLQRKIEWGSQIRSYVLCPYTMVKDHRTGFEVGDADAVLDGELKNFIIEKLKMDKSNGSI